MSTIIATEVALPGRVEPEGPTVTTRELPPTRPGEALVRMEATGVSFAEQQMRRGKYYDQPAFPFVPGYDIVGEVVAVGAGVDPALIGRRVAALTKIGGWSSHLTVPAGDLVPVPDGLGAEAAETFVVNGITAWQMLHRSAKVRAGQTILVHGANGGVGSTLVQLARAAGIRVIGTASARNADAVATLGATPVDYRGDVAAQVRALAPGGVDAVFDHVGGTGIVDSFGLLAPGGTLVSYGSAATKNEEGDSRLPVLKLFARLLWWNALPNKRNASFYNIWAGRRRLSRFRARLAADLAGVFELAERGVLHPQIAARIPLRETARALTLAESGTVTGKVVLVGDRES
ncbi:medium chain dehydrogenase/reductase family protein [Nocardia seriolae]|uniref:medium chain dehydrogenase/reductase family protein n=1 Tax=Nocardia seriolae TaxID=37332 RepID=UPI00090C77A7|nr:medium chain dehydrogenase/reductase family protein [Nocardia seriolae]MTJ60532.1 zinc-binding dehydrogenase [Nocardia seriolae]MTJ72237.1 zinc-binding dehydrogenase [Nocardia seriolae]MTJ84584.1 zinc-binding dehydrogenase [Nocardia seriolae]MTK28572.1 zinc-binding dehydrogenase [Nocardia seriolae]MTK38515.1 zinc-binding dehydrogenase [Nocardia seriolae]